MNDELARQVRRWRRRRRTVVLTSGCFDILHIGHVRYLQRARRLGDVLVVALNSDASVRRLKGPDRPLNPAAERAGVLAALSCVDFVQVFDEPTPERVIEIVQPDVYVKGGDYRRVDLVETPLVEALGGRVVIAEQTAGRSTSSLLRRIRER